jgi:Coenzyme PQQ synthesis protein D (PqqD)
MGTLAGNAVLVPASDVHARPFDGELVVLDLKSNAYFGLDEIGARIWSEFAQGFDIDTTVLRLAEEYDAPRSEIDADVRELAEKLVEAGLLVVKNAP